MKNQGHLGIVGGGQLGWMLARAANRLGLAVTVLDPNPDSPAAHAATHLCAAFDDAEALDKLGQADWVTFEFENVPQESMEQLQASTLVAPNPNSLRLASDRWVEKSTFQELGIETAAFRKIDSLADARKAWRELGPLVLKTRRFGYDGKGQARVTHQEQLTAAYESLKGAPAIAEQFVSFDCELSVVLCRSAQGKCNIYPLFENQHDQGILARSLCPAPSINEALTLRANQLAQTLADHLDYVGVLALELFLVGNQLLANEFAPRVHNSGHGSIEGCVTSQFENHVRAVCGWPLGTSTLRAPSVMLNLLGQVPPLSDLLKVPDCHVHDYRKRARTGRKVGHVTCLGATTEEAGARAQNAQRIIAERPADPAS